MKFSEILHKEKVRLDVTQAEFCKILYGVPRRTLQLWLSGKSEPPGYTQELILFKLKNITRVLQEWET